MSLCFNVEQIVCTILSDWVQGSSSTSKWGQCPPPPTPAYSLLLITIHSVFENCWYKNYLDFWGNCAGETDTLMRCSVATTCKTLLWWKGVFIIVFLFYICFYWQTDSSRTLKTQIFHESKGKKPLPKWICGERELVRRMMGLVTALLAWAWAVLLRPGLTERAEWVIVNEQS